MNEENDQIIKITEKLNTIKKQNTYEIIFNQLHDLIISGELKSGQKLPGERILSEKFGSSRNSVRLAIKLLEFMNLLEVRPGSGVYISSKKNLELASIERNWHKISKHHPLMDLIETRKCFEPFIAALAAANATDDEIKKMSETIDSMEVNVKSGKDIKQQASIFHKLLFEASKNIILNQIGLILQNLSFESKRISLTKNEHVLQSFKDHQDIFIAIKEHNPETAMKAMTKHLDSVEKHLKCVVDNSNA